MRMRIFVFLAVVWIASNAADLRAAEPPPEPVWVEITFREHEQKIQYILGSVAPNYKEQLKDDRGFLTLSNVFFMTGDGPRRYKDDPLFEGTMNLRLAQIVRVAPISKAWIDKWKERLLAPPVPQAAQPVRPPKPPEEKF